MKQEEMVPFSSLTTFGVGGSARFVLSGGGVSEVKEALSFSEDKSIPLIVLGGGSNMLGCDGVSDAVFFKVTAGGVDHTKEGDEVILTAHAGERWDDIVSYAVANGFFGFENLSGIPGNVGGALVQNIGAYGSALSNTVLEVEVFDIQEGIVRTLSKEECLFGYRTSLFKLHSARFVILRGTFRLKKGGIVNTTYKDLQEAFGDSTPELSLVRDTVIAIRARKFPDIRKEGTAGSFFKNPIVTEAQAGALKARFPDVPLFSIPEEAGVKVPLAWFLDKVMQLRGFTVGNVRCFEAQPLVIVASRDAKASEVRAFASLIQSRVLNEIGVSITPEVCVLNQNILTTGLTF